MHIWHEQMLFWLVLLFAQWELCQIMYKLFMAIKSMQDKLLIEGMNIMLKMHTMQYTQVYILVCTNLYSEAL